MGPRMAQIPVLGPSPGPVLKPQNDRIVVQIIRFPYRVLAIMTHPQGSQMGPILSLPGSPPEPESPCMQLKPVKYRPWAGPKIGSKSGVPGAGPRIQGPGPGPG